MLSFYSNLRRHFSNENNRCANLRRHFSNEKNHQDARSNHIYHLVTRRFNGGMLNTPSHHIYHLVTRRFNGGNVKHTLSPHLASFQNITSI